MSIFEVFPYGLDEFDIDENVGRFERPVLFVAEAIISTEVEILRLVGKREASLAEADLKSLLIEYYPAMVFSLLGDIPRGAEKSVRETQAKMQSIIAGELDRSEGMATIAETRRSLESVIPKVRTPLRQKIWVFVHDDGSATGAAQTLEISPSTATEAHGQQARMLMASKLLAEADS